MQNQHEELWSIWVKDRSGELHVVGLVCEETVVMDYLQFLDVVPNYSEVYWSADLGCKARTSATEKSDLRLYVVTKFTGPIYMN